MDDSLLNPDIGNFLEVNDDFECDIFELGFLGDRLWGGIGYFLKHFGLQFLEALIFFLPSEYIGLS